MRYIISRIVVLTLALHLSRAMELAKRVIYIESRVVAHSFAHHLM